MISAGDNIMLSIYGENNRVYMLLDLIRKWKRIDVSAVFSERVSMPEFTIMAGIKRISTGKESVFVSDIVKSFSMSAQEVSKYLKICGGKDFIRRETDSRDRRNTMLFLTDKGNQILEICESELRSFYESLINELDECELERVTAAVDKMYNRTVERLNCRKASEN